MHLDPFEQAFYNIANAQIHSYPYPHFFVESVFPEDFYEELLSFLPSTEAYQSLAKTDQVVPGSYAKRYLLKLENEELAAKLPFSHLIFWQKLAARLKSAEFTQLLIQKFYPYLQNRFQDKLKDLSFTAVAELLRDFKQYSIGPHTDHPVRAMTLLFYFPKSSKQAHLGTSIYRPLQPGFRCEGLVHHSFEQFIKIHEVPFLQGSVFGFFKNDHSFHGVEVLHEKSCERNLLNYYLRWDSSVK